jgi:hypothetical protein
MNIVAELSREHSKAMCNRVVRYVGDSPARFGELVKAFLGGPYRITQRSGWPLGCCVEKHPHLIRPYLRSLIRNLERPGQHDSVKRNTVRLLQFITIPKSVRGIAADVCFKFLADSKEPIAVRVFSMTVLANIAKVEPVLKQEVKIIIEDQMPYASAGMLARAKKVLKELKD